jgi:hypothetical protein
MAANIGMANIGTAKISTTKIGSAVAAALTAGLLSLALATPSTAAGSDQHARVTKHRPHHAYVARPRYFAHAAPPAAARYSGYPYIPPNAIIEPGFVFVPGVGILGESCDLPTSSCDNAYRDVQ